MGVIDPNAIREPESIQLGLDARDAADVAARLTRAVSGVATRTPERQQRHREQPVHGNRGGRIPTPASS
ncbi:MAG: hypothetical protein NCW75_05635 [Phycisphaera sp.]|nr:MAG: hypothetical protein NCW75_05635 [Phycisphaera sp.]